MSPWGRYPRRGETDVLMNGIGKFNRTSLLTQSLSPRYNDDTLFTYFLVPLMSGALTGPMILTDYLIHISTHAVHAKAQLPYSYRITFGNIANHVIVPTNEQFLDTFLLLGAR